MTERYSGESISNAIQTEWAGRTVHFAEETDSTNEWVKRLAREGAAHGTLAAVEFQSAGKGRLGRSWQAPRGSSVMMSILLRPEFSPERAPMLTLVMGLSVAQAVECLGGRETNPVENAAASQQNGGDFSVSIKWPNDVVISHKKICGILTEMGLENGKIDYVVIGDGINVNLEEIPKELKDKATSLYLESGRRFDRNRVVALVMERFEKNYDKFVKTCDLSLLLDDYNRMLANRDQPVRILDKKDPCEGVALGIDKDGELLVRTKDGRLRRIFGGEISVRGLYSYV